MACYNIEYNGTLTRLVLSFSFFGCLVGCDAWFLCFSESRNQLARRQHAPVQRLVFFIGACQEEKYAANNSRENSWWHFWSGNIVKYSTDLIFIYDVCYDSNFYMKRIVKPNAVLIWTYSSSSTAQGHGAKGVNEYKFSLEFLEPVRPEVLIFYPCTSMMLKCIIISSLKYDLD